MPSRPLLVLCPFLPPHIGGVETHLEDLMRHLELRGVTSVVLGFHSGLPGREPRVEIRGCVTVHRTRLFSARRFNSLEKIPALAFLYFTGGLLWLLLLEILKGRRFSHVLAHGLNAAVVAKLHRLAGGPPFTVQTHAIYGFENGTPIDRIARFSLGGASGVLCLSDPSLLEIKALGILPASRYRYWVDLDRFRPVDEEGRIALRAAVGLGSGTILLFVGRLLPWKGIDLLLEIVRERPDWTLVVAGTGPEERKIRESAAIHPNLVFLGAVPNEKLPDLYPVADFTLVPSLYPEGFGRVVAESHACGTPCIASPRGGLVEAVGDGGTLVETNPPEWIEEIGRLAAVPGPAARERRRKARESAELLYGVANADSILEKLGAKASRPG